MLLRAGHNGLRDAAYRGYVCARAAVAQEVRIQEGLRTGADLMLYLTLLYYVLSCRKNMRKAAKETAEETTIAGTAGAETPSAEAIDYTEYPD